ncbi:MAG TPA: dienelactone hydrolase family protein [Candidatus Pseudomonas excrementavium]|uniref:alpha/beta hydrolase family protein n=1 Tax=Halopseudomonas bauzanensis TaxID=653930 RepID=UPI001C39D95D|nr:dienelactone hydrolase family protein [Halopseudomonas bauzanensis]HIZ51049.1 dienelactone hydrolase family protein [Candidatus Pseudomonas excrementavium]
MINKNLSQSLLAMMAAGALLLSSSAFATNPPTDGSPTDPGQSYERGPDPSVAFLEASTGPYSVRTSRVSRLVSGFGGGTIHYPTGTTGTMAAIVVIPGFVSAESSIDWWGPKLASHGFVVMTIDTNTGFDQPPSRARQINSALDYLVDQNSRRTSPVNGMIDTERLGVIGWSMGGGGTLRVASEGRIKAAIPLAPWDTTRFSGVQAPTLIFACESDLIAPVRSHASPFYNQLPNDIDKAYVEINNGSHYCANGGGLNNDVLSRFGVSWMKRFLDNDTRYSQFLCGPNHESDRNISEYRGNCPY